jgi:hypothetical protein
MEFHMNQFHIMKTFWMKYNLFPFLAKIIIIIILFNKIR